MKKSVPGGVSPARILVLMDWVFSAFEEEIKRGVDRYVAEGGVEAVYIGLGGMNPDTPEDAAKDGFFSLVSGREFDGAIVVTNALVNMGGEKRLKERLGGLRGMPMVSIGPSLTGEDSVAIDNDGGMRSVMDHLIGHHGYRRFAFVSGPASNEDAQARLRIFRESLEAAGIRQGDESVFYGNFIPPSGEEAVEELLGRRALRPEVIVCANDLMALGVWTALGERGLSCPHDVAVTGFDDNQLMRVLSHQFTTVRQPFDDLGYLAAARLHASIRGLPLPGSRVMPTRLRVRGSCGCVEIQPPSEDECSSDELRYVRELVDQGRNIVRGKGIRQGTRDLCRAWSGVAQRHIAEGGPVYELEEIIRVARSAFAGDRGEAEAEAFLNALRSTLLEECAQSLFAATWKEQLFSMSLRMDTDDLQVALSLNPDLSAHAERFEAIARRCGTKYLSVLRFADPERPEAGAVPVFTFDESGGKARTEPGSFFPRGLGATAANMLTVDNQRIGYLLMETASVPPAAIDYLRIRLSGIFRDHGIMGNVRQLNSDMAKEITARIESERRLKEALDLVEQLSIKDELTGLHNRRGFLTLAEQQVKLLRRNKSGFFVLYADLDGLKPINDTWGHGDGDLAIRTAGRVLHESLRDSDIVARLGGDEFTALVSQADPPSVNAVLRRIREGCERASAELGRPWRVSLSIGHFFARPDCDFDVERMLELADAELYKEKQRKRGAFRADD